VKEPADFKCVTLFIVGIYVINICDKIKISNSTEIISLSLSFHSIFLKNPVTVLIIRYLTLKVISLCIGSITHLVVDNFLILVCEIVIVKTCFICNQLGNII